MGEIKVGDTVRVTDPSGFIVSVAKKIADRDAVVISVFDRFGSKRCRLEFQKRNGRGKVFQETLDARYLHVVNEAQRSK